MGKLESNFRRILKLKSKSTQQTGYKYQPPESMTPKRGQFRRPWVIVLDLAILYLLTFPFLNAAIGPVSAALVTIPVVSAGWLFGVLAGLVGSLVGIVMSSLLLYFYAGFGWPDLLYGWPGFVLVILFGYVAGYLHDMSLARNRNGEESASRERFIALISIATRNILGSEKQADAYYRLIFHLTNLFVADYGYLVRWDEKKQQAALVASTNSQEEQISPAILEPDEASLVVETLQAERAKVIENVQNTAYVVNPPPFKDLSLQTKSALVIPLITKDYCFGVAILAFDITRRFTQDEMLYVELAANQSTLALRAIHQQLELKAKFKEAKALASIGRALSESEHTGVDRVLQLIVESARELIPKAKNVILHLADMEKEVLVPRAVVGYRDKTKRALNMRLGEGIAGVVMTTGKVINITDVFSDPRFLSQTIPVKFRSLVVAPILGKEGCIGTISIQSDAANAFDEGEITLLEALGTQVAIGIDNAYLLETTRQNLKEINILYRISQDLARSLDPDQLMKDVADLLRQSFEFHHVIIYLVDRENGNLVARQGSGKIATHLVEEGNHISMGEGIIGHVALTAKPFLTNAVENILFYLSHPELADVKSELTVPIIIDDQVVGILDVQQTTSHPFTSHQLDLLTAVADQLAVALQKANLYNTLQATLTQEKAMRSKLIESERLAVAGQLLASVSHELNNPLQAIQNVLFLLEQDENLSEQGKQDLKIILSEVERMASLLNRLRTTYRPIRLDDIENIKLNEIVEDTYSLTSTHMRHNEITFEFHPDPGLPAIRGVSDRIRQVVLNIFINAIEAMQTGGHLTVCTESASAHGQIILTVTDTGPGIDANILPRIFDAFFTTKKSGTGLGLSITSDIISQHGGEIQVENNQQGGATFRICFPAESVE